jgi:DNA-directed RNA polymerase subunit RPC12/RpoP
MADVDFHEIAFQCTKCGHEIKQTIGRLEASEHMACPGCGVGIVIILLADFGMRFVELWLKPVVTALASTVIPVSRPTRPHRGGPIA